MQKIIVGFAVLAAVMLGVPSALYLWYVVQGHYVGGQMVVGEVMKNIADNHLDPLECLKIEHNPFEPFKYPPISSIRDGCIHGVAFSQRDPSICTLLLPKENGMYCIGSIWGPLIDESNCLWYKDNAVRCFEGPKLIPHIFDCGDPEQRAVSDECKHRFAFKQKDPTLCEDMTNPTLQSVCKVRIDIWRKYPELRSTIYFNDDIK